MPVTARRRTRNKSDDLIPTQADTSKGPTPKKAKTKRTESDPDKENVVKDDNILVETVSKAGYILKTGGELNILTKDQAVFLKAAHKDITTHIQYPENVQEMMATLEEYLEDREFLRKCLAPTVTSSNCDSARSNTQECFLRLLLNLPDLQPKLLKLLLEKLAEISLDDDSPPPSIGSQKVNIPRQILSAVRWLDKIVNGSELAEHVMMILQATNTDVQMEIITAVPEIVDDAHHPQIAMGLRDLYGAPGKQELTATLLDAFTNLNLSPDLLSDLRGTVMKTVRTVPLSDLPTVVKFILGVIPSGEASAVIQELRDNLDLTPPSTQRPGPSSPKKRLLQARKNVECIILDAIKMSAAMDKSVADAWIKAVESVRDVEDHKPEDILITLLLQEMPNKKKLIESLTRNKVRNGLYTEDLLKATFNLHPTALKQHFNAIIALAEEMLQSSEPTVSRFALVLYREAFVHLDGYFRQEVVGDLVSKVGYGGGGPLTAGALGVLDHLAAEHPDKLADYALFVSAVLEYLDNMTLCQVRQIMGILASLAWRPGHGENVGGGVVQDDLHIVIRKQLDSGNSVYKRMGVVGAVTAVKAMGMVGDEEFVPSSHVSQDTSSNSHMPQGSLRNAKMLLEMVKAKTRTSQEAAGLFLDELAYAVSCGKINTKLMEWISSKITDDFTDDYVIDLTGSKEQQCQSLSVSYQMVLDEPDEDASDDDSTITLNLAPIVIKSLHLPGKDGESPAPVRPDQLAAPARLIPLFRLLYCATAATGKGDLDDIDALLGCGIWLPSEDEKPVEAMSVVEKNAVCSCLFYAINWCREIVNAFATQEDVELKNKVLMRMKHILELQERLQVSLKYNPNFVPPAAQFLEDTSAWNPPATVEKGKAKGGKGKGRGKKGKAAPIDGDATVNLNTQGTQGATPPSASLPHNQTAANTTNKVKQVVSVDLAHYRPFFREMDLNVLQVLRYGNLSVESSPDLHEEIKEPKLRPPEFEFLLQDLILKMEHSLVSTTSKKRGFPGKGNNLHTIGYSNLDRIPPKKIAAEVAQHLQPLFQHIDEIVQYFQRLVAMNDGDTGGLLLDQGPLLCRCLSLSFRVAKNLFSWTGFQAAEARSTLKEALLQLVSRVDACTADSTVPSLVESCIKYLVKFTDAIVDVEVAGHHLLLMEALHKLSGKSATAAHLARVSEEYLKKDWMDPEGVKCKGAEFNTHVEKLVTVYLQYSQDCVDAVDGLCVEGIINMIEKTKKDAASDEFPTITKGTVSFFYKSMLTTLVNKVRGITYGVTKDPDEQLETWCRTIASLHRCILLLKTWSNRPMLSAVLKLSRQFLDHFFRHGMPLLDKVFRRKRDDCTSLLKNLQLSTRFLQHVCSHSKIMKDVSLSNNVPLLKKSLEVFVYRVKAMLAANNCIEIFWMGNLKNRDLQGEEILSQASRVEDDDDESEGEEELPEEDDESDVEVGDDSSEKNDDRDDGDSAISIEI